MNTFPSALEVLGAPLTGSDVRAYVMSGGGIRIRGLTPKFSTKRAYLIFPVRGSERRGLVSVEAKKRHGKVRDTKRRASSASSRRGTAACGLCGRRRTLLEIWFHTPPARLQKQTIVRDDGQIDDVQSFPGVCSMTHNMTAANARLDELVPGRRCAAVADVAAPSDPLPRGCGACSTSSS